MAIVVAIFYPFSQFCEMDSSLLSLQKQPKTAPSISEGGGILQMRQRRKQPFYYPFIQLFVQNVNGCFQEFSAKSVNPEIYPERIMIIISIIINSITIIILLVTTFSI